VQLSQTSESYSQQSHKWLGSAEGTQSQRSVTIPVAALTEGTHYPTGVLADGLALAKATSGTYSGKFVPLAARVNEVQTVTITGTPTGGTFTLTFDGSTTAAIAYNATASAVQSALEALPSVDTGAVVVTGGPGPSTAFTVTFSGAQFQGSNVPAMTASGASLTGGTSPDVTIATPTGGGSGVTDGSDVLFGFLYLPVAVPSGATVVHGSAIVHGLIKEAGLPIALTAQQKATNTHFVWL
jgi:hypothetical protein